MESVFKALHSGGITSLTSIQTILPLFPCYYDTEIALPSTTKLFNVAATVDN